MRKAFKVAILGGGTAGWMTAAYLAKMLKHNLEVTLIESETINTIGVGEATFSTIQLYLQCLGLSERDWMPHCGASYKTAIKFVDWNADRRHFYHPFQRFESAGGRPIVEWWLKSLKGKVPFDYACFSVPTLCDQQRSPRFMDGRVFDATVSDMLCSDRTDRALLLDTLTIQYPYAYHFDAGLFAKFLSKYAQALGVRRIADDVVDVALDNAGCIGTLLTARHGPVTADLFVDCSGFKGLLINKALGEPFISFGDSLLCDSALATQIPIDTKREGINPFTTATALSAGWVWRIPLFSRIGTGYVYSSAFASRDEAEREFRQYLGAAGRDCRLAAIKMRVGRCRRSWVRNCVAIGLASGFVEPLESTGIFFIQHGIEQLATHFPRHGNDEDAAAAYNEAVADCIDGVREFLTLHYAAGTRRDTPFWKATKTDLAVPPELSERLRMWRQRLPTNRTINTRYHGFESYSYAVMLLGLGAGPENGPAVLDHMDDAPALDAFRTIRERADTLRQALPSLYDYLNALHHAAGLIAPEATAPHEPTATSLSAGV